MDEREGFSPLWRKGSGFTFDEKGRKRRKWSWSFLFFVGGESSNGGAGSGGEGEEEVDAARLRPPPPPPSSQRRSRRPWQKVVKASFLLAAGCVCVSVCAPLTAEL